MNPIFFSVVLTSYNSSKYIENTLNNLLNQKFKNFEVILVDDGSKDNTIEIAKKFKNIKKFNLKIICLNHNGSPARSRNFGIKNSKGKYICFLDADDFFFKNKLTSLYNATLKMKYDVFYHNVYLKHKNIILYSKEISSQNSFKDLILNGNKIVLSSSTVNRSFLIKKKN